MYMHALCLANSKSEMTIMYGPLVIMRRPSYKIKTCYSYPIARVSISAVCTKYGCNFMA